VNRAQNDFDERDRAMLNVARPHLAQLWRRAREYERLASLLAATSAVLSGSGSGVVVLTEPIDELTPDALVQLYRFFGRPAPRAPLPPRVRNWVEAFRTDGESSELPRPLKARLDGRQLVLRYLPGRRGLPDVILLDEVATDPSSDVLRAVGLSEREEAVVRLVGNGASNADIAAQLSLSVWTVKRHLANIYTKLGVSNRVRLAALALEIDAHHRPTRP
jgi:DNA-binding CsgD family transcriptional regulator